MNDGMTAKWNGQTQDTIPVCLQKNEENIQKNAKAAGMQVSKLWMKNFLNM